MYLSGIYFLFSCQRSELILSCQLCMLYSQHNASFFSRRLAEVQHFHNFQSCCQKSLLLGLCLAEERSEKIIFLDICKLQISHIFRQCQKLDFAFHPDSNPYLDILYEHAANPCILRSSSASEIPTSLKLKCMKSFSFRTLEPQMKRGRRCISPKCRVPLEPRWILGNQSFQDIKLSLFLLNNMLSKFSSGKGGLPPP